MNFSFAGCGFLGIYHVGVASCLRQHAPHLLNDCQFAGASAGAIVACCLMCGCCLGDCTTFTLRLATKARSFSIGPLHPSFKLTKILRDALREVLPDNAHEIATGRLHISFTRVKDRENVIVSEYSSKEELIQALMCSAHVPLYSGFVPPTYRGVRYVDGGLSDNIPALDENTITVSPFAGESDICPSDKSFNPLHVYVANTSMQCTMGNLYRLSRALFPPHPETLSDMCQQGFDDCLKFLQNNKLLSCVRHLSVRSIVTRVPIESEPVSEECDEKDCHECKSRKRLALVDKLPVKVGSALQEACESVNKGMKAYIYRHRSLRLMSFLATPWFLPVDIAYTYAVRFLQYLPHMPYDVQMMYHETAGLMRYLISNIHHHRRHYTARFTCQLAITEVNYSELDHDIFPQYHTSHAPTPGPSHAHHHTHPHPHPATHPHPHVQPHYRNVNFEFAVDLESKLGERKTEIHESTPNLGPESATPTQHFQFTQQRQRSGSASGRLCNYPRSDRRKHREDNHEMFDTFEQCLHVSNKMESVMAYHYQIEGNKGCYMFEEIYTLRDSDLDLSKVGIDELGSSQNVSRLRSTSTDQGQLGATSGRSHLESDIERFVVNHSDIVIRENQMMEES